MNYFNKLNKIFDFDGCDVEEIVDYNNYVPLSSGLVMFGDSNPMRNHAVKEAHATRMKELAKEKEWKEKLMSAIRTEEYRQKMREIVTGRTHSEDTKKKQSESAKKAGTGLWMKDRPKSDEHKDNIRSAALKRERIPCCKCGKGFTKANLQKHERSCSGKS